MKVAFLTNIVSPYRLPVFQKLNQEQDWQLRVFVNAANEFDRDWRVDTHGLDVKPTKSFSIKRTVRSEKPVRFDQTITLHLPVGLWGDLKHFKPDVVISHELGPRTMVAAAYCRRFKIPFVIWAYQSRVSATQAGGIKPWVRRKLLKQADMVVGMGMQARQVLRAWGVSDDKIVDAPNACDHTGLAHRFQADTCLNEAAQIRRSIDSTGTKRIAAVFGRLVPLKGTGTLLEQWGAMPQAVREQWHLVFVGNGPLASIVDRCGDPSITRIPAVDPSRMADWYRAADLHVFPTLGDVWGLVVNEAMTCQTPSLCSIHAGCFDDLVNEGVDGFGYDPTKDDAADRLAEVLSNQRLEIMGQAAAEHIQPFTLDRLAQVFRIAASQAIKRAPFSEASSVTMPVSG